MDRERPPFAAVPDANSRALTLPRSCSQAGDAFATSRVAVAIAKLCWERKDYKQLNAQIMVLSKRRGQLKQVSAARVHAACSGCCADVLTPVRLLRSGRLGPGTVRHGIY